MALNHVNVGESLPGALNEERDAINALTQDVATRIKLPTGLQTGDLLVWDGTKIISTETRFIEGDGRPEGAVAAPVGSRYIDKTAATGAAEWVKRTGGDSNSGWLVVAGDTGVRNITTLFSKPAGSSVATATVRRVGMVVDLYVDLVTPNNAPEPWIPYVLPLGFRPPAVRHGGLHAAFGTASTATYVNSNGELAFRGVEKNITERYSGTWTTLDAWPTTLPGT